jgi:hypothetical protein
MSKRTQVITITVEGTMSGLQVKPGQGIDLTSFGRAKVTRASEIVWSETHQKWFVDVLQEAGRGPITKDAFEAAYLTPEGGTTIDEELDFLADDGWQIAPVEGSGLPEGALLFTNYDQAVGVEVEYLNALRLKGQY